MAGVDSIETIEWLTTAETPDGHGIIDDEGNFDGECPAYLDTCDAGDCNDSDGDGDAVIDVCDACPFTDNSLDSDDDGILDCADPCDSDGFFASSPDCDPGGDFDCDGTCNGVDDCPFASNTSHTNANSHAEAAWEAVVMADACEPVPVPAGEPRPFEVLESQSVTSSFFTSEFKRVRQDRVQIRPLRSRSARFTMTAADFVPEDVPTRFRYCQYEEGATPCDAPTLVDTFELHMEVPDALSEMSSFRYHRVSMSFAPGGNNRGADVVLDYDDSPHNWRWFYQSDASFWQTTGLMVIPPPEDNAIHQGGTWSGLDGRFWVHAATTLGTPGNNVGTGTHVAPDLGRRRFTGGRMARLRSRGPCAVQLLARAAQTSCNRALRRRYRHRVPAPPRSPRIGLAGASRCQRLRDLHQAAAEQGSRKSVQRARERTALCRRSGPAPVNWHWLLAVCLSACAKEPEPLALEPVGGAVAWDSSSSISYGVMSSSSTGVYSTCGDIAGSHPAPIPENWVEWTCDPGCTFWLPPDLASMPPPIEWEACAPLAAYPDCQEMRADWSDGDGDPIVTDIGFATDSAGTTRLLLGRKAINGYGDAQSYFDWVVGDVDGELDFALRNPWPFNCGAFIGNLSNDTFALSLYGPNKDYDIDALLIGRVGSLTPEMPYHNQAEGQSAWYAGSEWVVKLDYGSQLLLLPHDFSSQVPLYNPGMNPDGAGFSPKPWFIGRDVLFQTGNYVTASIWAYDDVRGTHPLIAYPGDTTRGAINLGTDGEDLVWTLGEGKEENAFGLYPEVSIMTAPYTTDPAALEPRRLRNDLSLGIGTHELQFAVGCGHAGRVLANGQDAEIVRLSDGAGWVLQGSDDWRWQRVLGFTCDELFIAVHNRAIKKFNVARLPLAALGEPLPPD